MQGPTQLVLAGGTVDLRRRKFITPHAEVKLTAREVQVLTHLHMAGGAPVSRETLEREVWEHQPGVQSRAIDQAFKRLRAKLEIDPKSPEHIVTVHGVGYQLLIDTDHTCTKRPHRLHRAS